MLIAGEQAVQLQIQGYLGFHSINIFKILILLLTVNQLLPTFLPRVLDMW